MGLDNPLHLAVLVVILLLLFGAKRLPEIGRSLGTGMREFKDSISPGSHSSQTQQTLPPAAQAPAQAQPVPQPVAAPAQPAPPAAATQQQPVAVPPAEPAPPGLTGNPFGT